jgi:uncharacterized repeat protein (TIGR03803 family)
MRQTTRRIALFFCFALSLGVLSNIAQAQTFSVLHSFTDGPDGGFPQAGLTMDAAGNLYGTNGTGGLPNHCISEGCGTVFRLTNRDSGWQFTTLYSFQGDGDGDAPTARVVFGPGGALYGTTLGGGLLNCEGDVPGCGVIFRIQPSRGFCRSVLCPWTETFLYRFPGGAMGGIPEGDIIFDPEGNIYGTLLSGGSTGPNCGTFGCGMVYELAQVGGGMETVLYTFQGGLDGRSPAGGVIRDAAGNLYGTTLEGGGYGCGGSGCGTVFELSPSPSGWTETILHSFQGSTDGDLPYAGLTMDAAGNLYGSTSSDGPGNGGTVFELSPNGSSWTFSTLYSLTGIFLGGPQDALTLDNAGSIYGAAQYDGAYSQGSVFKLTYANGSWLYTDIYDFASAGSGGWLFDGLVLDRQGNIFGTTFHGGVHAYGNAFKITP